MLQTGSLLCFDKMVEGHRQRLRGQIHAIRLETVTEALKFGGITGMMNRLSNPAKSRRTRSRSG